MAVNDEFKLKIKVDSSEAVGGFDSISESVTGFSNDVKGSQSSLDRISGAFDRLSVGIIATNQAVQLASAAFDQLSKAISFTAGSSVTLQASVAEINTLLDDQSLKISTVTEDILNLQSQFGGSQTDIATSFYNALSAGVSDVSTSLEFLQDAQKLAIGGVTNLNTAVGGLSTIMRAYSLDASDTSSVSDALFIGMKFGRTTIEELSNSLGALAGPAASSNIKFQEMIAVVANVATVTGDTNRAVTSVRSAIIALARPTDSLKALWKQMSDVTIETALANDGLVTTLERISDAAGGSTKALIDLFGSTEALPAITALTSNAINATFRKTLEEMGIAAQDAGKVTEEAFQKIASTVQFQANLVKGNVQASFTRIGLSLLEALMPAFKILAEVIKSAASVLETLATAFGKLDTMPFVGMLLAVAAALKLATVAWATFQSALAASKATQGIISTFDILILKSNAFTLSLGKAIGKMKLFAAAGLKIAVIAIAMATIVVAIELIVRNFDRLDDVADFVLVTLATGFLNLLQTITMARIKFLEFTNVFGINDDKIQELNGFLIENGETIGKNQEALKDFSKTLDTGFSGKAIKSIISALDSMGEKTEDQKETLDEIAAKERERLEALRKQRLEMEAMNGLLTKFDNLKLKSLEGEKNAGRLIEFQTKLQLKKISKLVEELKLIKGITAQQRRLLAETAKGAKEQTLIQEKAKLDALRLKLTKNRLNTEINILRLQTQTLNISEKIAESDKNKIDLININLDIRKKILDNMLKQKFFNDDAKKRAEENVAALKEQLDLQADLAKIEITGISVGDVLDDLRSVFSESNFKKLGEGAVSLWDSSVEAAKDLVNTFDSPDKFMGAMKEIGQGIVDLDIGKKISDGLRSINLTEVGAGLKKMAEFAFEGITAIFSPDAVNAVADGIENSLLKLPQMLIESWSNLSMILTQFIETFPDALTKMLDMLPGIIQSVLDKLPAFIKVIIDSLIQVITMIPGIVAQIVEKIPEILVTILDKLPEVIDRLFEAIPQVFILLISKIPEIITNIIDRLPKILERLIAGLIGGAGEMAIAFVEMLITGLPEIIAALIKAIPKLIVALVKGIAIGLKRIFGALFGGIKLPKTNTKAIADDMLKQISKSFSGSGISEDLFGLVGLGGAPKEKKKEGEEDTEDQTLLGNIQSASMSFWDNFVKAFEDIGAFLVTVMKGLWMIVEAIFDGVMAVVEFIVKGLTVAFEWLGENIIKPIGELIGVIIEGIVNFFKRIPMLITEGLAGVIKFFTETLPEIFNGFARFISGMVTGIIKGFTEAFTWIKAKIFDPIVDAIEFVFAWIKDKIFDPIIAGFKFAFNFIKESISAVFSWIKTSIFDPIVSAFTFVFNAVANIFKPITDAFATIFNAIGGIFDPIVEGFKSFVGAIAKVFEPILAVAGAGGGLVDSVSSIFHEGGEINRGTPLSSIGIKGYATGGAVDDTLITAQQGEYMIKKSSVESIGTGTLDAINKSGSLPNTGGGGNTTINISDGAIQITGSDDPQRVVDDILEELKRRSLDGEFLMSNQGLLAT